jgi:hypothetical protein
MKIPTNKYRNLWNDMPIAERQRLMPYEIECQLRYIWQCKQKAITAHKQYMKELDDWMANIKRELDKI